jgi:hypothetical protein
LTRRPFFWGGCLGIKSWTLKTYHLVVAKCSMDLKGLKGMVSTFEHIHKMCFALQRSKPKQAAVATYWPVEKVTRKQV